jgi:hypothetical protein
MASVSTGLLMVTIAFSIRAQYACDWVELNHVDSAKNLWAIWDAWTSRGEIGFGYRALTFDQPGSAGEVDRSWDDGAVGNCGSDEPVTRSRRSTWGKLGFDVTLVRSPRRFTWSTGYNQFHGFERCVHICLPYWFLMLLFAIGMAPLLSQAYLRRRSASRAAANHCVQCGYDLRATPQRCPECGTSR